MVSFHLLWVAGRIVTVTRQNQAELGKICPFRYAQPPPFRAIQ
jgi:hypothetical protein